jgi:hypothetical protein
MVSENKKEIKWIAPEDNPWNVPVLDLRPVVSELTSYSQDQQQAVNAISFQRDEGLGFINEKPKINRKIQSSIEYPIQVPLLDGILYTPTIMEDKWAVFYHDEKIIFVRSWLREVFVIGKTIKKDNKLIVIEIEGVFSSKDEKPESTELYFDFLIRNLVYGIVYPVPISKDLAKKPKEVPMWCFGLFGKIALVATPHPITNVKIEEPFRTNSLFHISIAKGDHQTVKKFLDKGVPADVLAKDGFTPLHWALMAKNFDIVNLLIEYGATIDDRGREGTTPLMNAVQASDPTIMKFLIENGADVNAEDNRGFTSLHRSAEMGNVELTLFLLEKGADKNIEAQGYTAKSLAEKENRTEIINILKNN